MVPWAVLFDFEFPSWVILGDAINDIFSLFLRHIHGDEAITKFIEMSLCIALLNTAVK
jgi:hypothetical protein